MYNNYVHSFLLEVILVFLVFFAVAANKALTVFTACTNANVPSVLYFSAFIKLAILHRTQTLNKTGPALSYAGFGSLLFSLNSVISADI